ncbi:Uma2 family endonuclease [Streptomyces sp. JJ66]|uniref:Uma2 family endonuclease n=1 Tax=Streptomyces sp. JJ66 TaxID=2803843 RepID=UPI001C572FEE|nr:Uma2 family endonuclease [Streptomyces sp. JJ66]MBW1604451.1 Uma2 family endonuclease [Streptomyces sp. JJ66]
MTAVAPEAPMSTAPAASDDVADVLWQAWKAMELPEGFHAEIVEGFIEVSPTGRYSHSKTIYRFRRALEGFLGGDSPYAAHQDMNLQHDQKVFVPDIYLAPEEDTAYVTEDGLGLDASCVELVVEVVSPGHDAQQRDRVRKRRAYARAGIPVYVILDDYDGHGTVTVLTQPSPGEAVYAAETRVPYGKDVTVPEGPAEGFTITEEITGPPQRTRAE